MPRSMREIILKADEIDAKHYRKHQNRRRRKALTDYEKGSWKLIVRGMPDFVAVRPFARFRAVWVPDKNGAFTIEQKRLQAIFRASGFDVAIVNLEARDFCAPQGGKQRPG